MFIGRPLLLASLLNIITASLEFIPEIQRYNVQAIERKYGTAYRGDGVESSSTTEGFQRIFIEGKKSPNGTVQILRGLLDLSTTYGYIPASEVPFNFKTQEACEYHLTGIKHTKSSFGNKSWDGNDRITFKLQFADPKEPKTQFSIYINASHESDDVRSFGNILAKTCREFCPVQTTASNVHQIKLKSWRHLSSLFPYEVMAYTSNEYTGLSGSTHGKDYYFTAIEFSTIYEANQLATYVNKHYLPVYTQSTAQQDISILPLDTSKGLASGFSYFADLNAHSLGITNVVVPFNLTGDSSQIFEIVDAIFSGYQLIVIVNNPSNIPKVQAIFDMIVYSTYSTIRSATTAFKLLLKTYLDKLKEDVKIQMDAIEKQTSVPSTALKQFSVEEFKNKQNKKNVDQLIFDSFHGKFCKKVKHSFDHYLVGRSNLKSNSCNNPLKQAMSTKPHVFGLPLLRQPLVIPFLQNPDAMHTSIHNAITRTQRPPMIESTIVIKPCGDASCKPEDEFAKMSKLMRGRTLTLNNKLINAKRAQYIGDDNKSNAIRYSGNHITHTWDPEAHVYGYSEATLNSMNNVLKTEIAKSNASINFIITANIMYLRKTVMDAATEIIKCSNSNECLINHWTYGGQETSSQPCIMNDLIHNANTCTNEIQKSIVSKIRDLSKSGTSRVDNK